MELAEAIAEIFVYLSGKHKPVGFGRQFVAMAEKVASGDHVSSFQQSVGQYVVTSLGNALIAVVEVVVVECQTHRQAADDECRQRAAWASPLLLGISFYEEVENVAPHERKCLLLEVARLGNSFGSHAGCSLGALTVYFGHSLCRSRRTPQPVEGVHVEWQIVEPAIGS